MSQIPATTAEVEKRCSDFRRTFDALRKEVGKVIVGHADIVDDSISCLFCAGHVLLEGVPGLGKTLLVRTLSAALSMTFRRIQFTPDLMPADITGTEILQETDRGDRVLRFMQGPIFANIILADEINRTPPKTQAALLEAMQEHHVTYGNRTFVLDEPFFVLATQNPIEQEGTYPLPEAQLDRFMFNILVDYPRRTEELQIMKTTTTAHVPQLEKMLNADEIIELQEIVRKVPVADHVYEYAVDLAIGTRPTDEAVRPFVKEWVSWGAGPRASQYLILGAKARAILSGRYHATTDDVKAVALPVLRHRVITNFNAESEGVTSDSLIKRLLEETPVKTK